MPDAAWVGVAMTLVGAALGLVWHSSKVTTRVEVTLEQLKIELTRVAGMADAVCRIPVIETRLVQVEHVVQRMNSDITELKVSTAQATWRTSGGQIG